MTTPMFRSAALVFLALFASPTLGGESSSLHLTNVPPFVGDELALLDPGARLYADRTLRQHPLHWAALQNQVRAATILIDQGMAVDDRDSQGRTPLMVAAAFDSPEVAELLIARGADLMARTRVTAETPLHFAALAGHVDMARILLGHGADIGARSLPANATPLHYAALFGHLKMIEYLIANGADPDVRDAKGMAPFQYASRRNRTPVMDLLLRLGASPDNIFEAINADDVGRVITLLHQGTDVNEPDLFGTPLHRAASSGHVAIMVILIDAGADLESIGEPDSAHPLHAAALASEAEAETLLIDRGASVDARDAAGRTPLMIAASFGNVEAAKVLLANGADPRAIDDTWMDSPIHYAALSGNVEMAELLLAYGADLNVPNANNGASPVHYAVAHSNPAMIEYLASHGANLDHRDGSGLTPYQLAGKRSQTRIAELLLRLGGRE